jgi:hypothetical protein
MFEQEIVEGEEVAVEETTTEAETETVEEEQIDWKARAMKAEALIVKNKKAPVAEKTTVQATPSNVEELVLQANGMSDELLVQLKKIAEINGTSLIKAQSDPIFVAVKEKFEREKKHENASLGASRGAGTVKAKKTFATPGLTQEEHKRMAMEALK